jgi:hypothetical protein
MRANPWLSTDVPSSGPPVSFISLVGNSKGVGTDATLRVWLDFFGTR